MKAQPTSSGLWRFLLVSRTMMLYLYQPADKLTTFTLNLYNPNTLEQFF